MTTEPTKPTKLPPLSPTPPTDDNAPAKRFVLDSNDPAQVGDGHWLRQGKTGPITTKWGSKLLKLPKKDSKMAEQKEEQAPVPLGTITPDSTAAGSDWLRRRARKPAPTPPQAEPPPRVGRATPTRNSISSGQGMNGIAQLLDALTFAAEKHRMQRRKDVDASPYINHPIAVASVLCSEGGITEMDVLCAALLHDTIEDTNTTEEELRARFGDTVAKIVAEVTDDKTLDKHRRKALQIEHAHALSRAAKLVKLADKICNLRDVTSAPPAHWSLQRRHEYFDWARQVVEGLRGIHSKLEAIFYSVYSDRPQR